MGLARYNQKRDFTKTQEPKGIKKTSAGALRFVVQKHAASHLHYDFRLEVDGVLASWAVPKGPSANPADKRLAMQVEDHPMDYIDFEGTIPKGEYGGGTVMVWDIGTYHALGNDEVKKDNALMKKQLREGNIKIVMNGGKLKGEWHLVAMHSDDGERKNWLLMKHRDEFAGAKKIFDQHSILSGRDLDEIAQGDNVWHSNRSASENVKSIEKKKSEKQETATLAGEEFSAEDLNAATRIKNFPDDWRPQLATLADAPFDNDDWLFETKFDGYRALAQIRSGDVELISRNGLSFSGKYPEIVKALEILRSDMILDGEIVAEDSKGNSRFQWLQHYADKGHGKLRFHVFDILYFEGFDLRALPLIQRKKILKAVLPKSESIVYSEHIIGQGTKAYEAAEKKGGEGIIAKKISSTYAENRRTRDWLKIKTQMEQEMVIGGFTEPSGSRVGLGALLVGYYKDGKLEYSGKVGSGYTEKILKELYSKLHKIKQQDCPFNRKPKMPGAIHWVRPELLAQIKFSEWTETGSMRHPVYLGLREDKPAKKVTREKPEVKTEKMDEETTGQPNAKVKSDKVELTNLDKVFWPGENITKGDVIAYYDAVADYLLPYLKDRPESLRRTPDGIKSTGFFQKNVAGMVPDWVETHMIKSESTGEMVEWLLCQNRDTLLYLANLGCIELNPWSSRVGSLDNPDYVIFDLDPNKADNKLLVKTAKMLKKVLDGIGVSGYIKTSGGKGLHVFISVLPKYSYEQTRDFSLLVSQMVQRKLPEIVSLERLPEKRIGKIYLDFLQNGKGKTMASVYSLRLREGAGVSTPIDWSELTPKFDPKKFNIHTVPDRLKQKGDLWKGIFDQRVDLKKILSNF